MTIGPVPIPRPAGRILGLEVIRAMQCPIDGTTLGMTERFGVEIDYCPECRGLWLDRGELDKILEHATAQPLGGRPDGERSAPGDGAHGERKKASRFSVLTDFLGGGE